MTALRQRMIADLRLRGYAERTVHAYVRVVARLAQHHRTPPDQLSEAQLRAYLVYLTSVRRFARPSLTIALCGLRFFYEQTLGRHWTILDVARPKRSNLTPLIVHEYCYLRSSCHFECNPKEQALIRRWWHEVHGARSARLGTISEIVTWTRTARGAPHQGAPCRS